jgi:23S rRNA pseudouridine2605 synthase
VEKVYRARVQPPRLPGTALARLREGVELEDGLTSPARARQVTAGVVEIALAEGRKRQVRRMLEAVGHRVVELERVRFGPLRLQGLAPGAHRRLTPSEVDALREAAGRPPA